MLQIISQFQKLKKQQNIWFKLQDIEATSKIVLYTFPTSIE